MIKSHKQFQIVIILFLLVQSYVVCQNFYFGDLHLHTNLSDGLSDIDSAYHFLKDSSKLDFSCISDHDIYPNIMHDTTWQKIINKANEYYVPGEFVSFIGYEWTSFGGDGHRIVIYPGEKGWLYRSSIYNLNDLYYYVKNNFGIISVAHPDAGQFSANFGTRDSSVQRLIEIDNGGFRAEYFGNPYAYPTQIKGKSVQDYLDFDELVGFIAVSDDHSKFPGKKGLTCIYANELTRTSLFNALKKRHTFATSGPRTNILLWCGNAIMGDIINIPNLNYNQTISLRGEGEHLIKNVEIIMNKSVLTTFEVNSTSFAFSYLINLFLSFTSVYVRVNFNDGNQAWTSPLYFVKNTILDLDKFSDLENNELVMIYPNPSNSSCKLFFSKKKFIPEKIELFNAIGQKIREYNFTDIEKNEMEIFLNNLVSGLYLLRIFVEDKLITKKIVLMK